MLEEVVIESLAAGGAGVAHLADGMIAFVPRTAPGDRVRLAQVKRHQRHAMARAAEIVEPSPHRVEPPCPHFTRDHCGGCQWQHLAPAVQHAAKRRIVGDALRRLAKLDVADPELVPGPRPYGYRTTITLTVRRRGGHVIAGFHDERDPDVVFPLERCHIARPEVQELWDAVAPAIPCLPKGDDVRLKLRVADDELLHAVVSGGEDAWTAGQPLVVAAAKRGLLLTVWWHPAGGAVRRVAGPDADPALVSFGQVNADVAELLRQAVIDGQTGRRPDGQGRLRILDLYAGAGETALPLARLGHDVTMVEMDSRAVRRAEERAQEEGIALTCLTGKVEQYLDRLLLADAVIVNPPRSGLSEAVTARLTVCPSARLTYVSCDPATLARDLGRMAVTSDRVTSLTAYDMFPQTSHVETVVVLS